MVKVKGVAMGWKRARLRPVARLAMRDASDKVARMSRLAFALAALALVSACATSGAPGGAVPPRGTATPSGPLDLGDWRRGSEAATLQRYSSALVRRYAPGLGMQVATGDLRANGFTCAPPAAGRTGGDPPDQVCRRASTDGDCTHTWQAHLWDDRPGAAQIVSRVRGLYDRRCKADGGLLGGPG
jgi:hypothetical protein